jgi:hypothetical protein
MAVINHIDMFLFSQYCSSDLCCKIIPFGLRVVATYFAYAVMGNNGSMG